MGTDIHLQVERRVNGAWEHVNCPESAYNEWWIERASEEESKGKSGVSARFFAKHCWGVGRNYELFAILADVRNGIGFAGVPTGDPVLPISPPKGLPEDLAKHEETSPWSEREAFWFGEHDQSWLTLQELLDYNWEGGTTLFGVITWKQFVERKRNKEFGSPTDYCGDIAGRDIVKFDEAEADLFIASGTVPTDPDNAYVRISWMETHRDSAGHFYESVIPALMDLADPVGAENVRIVFGFDS